MAVEYKDEIDRLVGVSYAGNPRDFTTLYLGKKFEQFAERLETVQGCLFFIENGVELSSKTLANNTCVFSNLPVTSFAHAAQALWEKEQTRLDALTYKTIDGTFMGEGVVLGENVRIEPGAFIDHEVNIGAGTRILSGARVRHGVSIGKNCLLKENCVVGGEGFTMAPTGVNTSMRLHDLAGVTIGDSVEVGSCATVNRGQSRNTFIGADTKIDDHAYIAHDDALGTNVTICAGVTIGGFVEIGDNAYLGMNCEVKQLQSVGAGSTIGMGAVVNKPVPANVVAFGNPAKVRRDA
jgi:UDP-3-O-[3-hydroxymyristoyl] glucosamine N-acyltransferase